MTNFKCNVISAKNRATLLASLVKPTSCVLAWLELAHPRLRPKANYTVLLAVFPGVRLVQVSTYSAITRPFVLCAVHFGAEIIFEY